MSINFNEKEKLFILTAKDTSYIIQLVQDGRLEHKYWGKSFRSSPISSNNREKDGNFRLFSDDENWIYSFNNISQEYPAFGNTDLKYPAYQFQLENGSRITDLKYSRHEIIKGKPSLDGLPATYVENENEAETLNIILFDELIGLYVTLSYTVFEAFNAITRSVKFVNTGKENLKMLRALSMSIDFNHSDFDLIQLSGTWGRERHIYKRALVPGSQGINSALGSSGHQQNPFLALMGKDSTEDFGDVYGFNLVYSGNFVANVDVDPHNKTRVSMGINPFDFSWLLEPNQSFQTPEVVMVYSGNGLTEMSQTYHKLYRTRLCRGKYKEAERPILINNWEATYFNFSEEKLLNIAKAGAEMGVELFVLDDGWFGKRNDDSCSLGDWFVNKEKLPNGLDNLAMKINEQGLKFGLWFEPEMVCPDSDLYRQNPDWCIHVPDRKRSEMRNQLILDMSREDVQNEIINRVSSILSSAPISYVKWDMNRQMTEIGSALLPANRQSETAHRYILGVYRVMNIITSAFPHVLFESCASGGGRFDPGILYYMPQTWTSDNTDAISRLKIQYGTSLVYPASSMGAHVSASPNHQVHRDTSLKTRGDVAMSGNFGYELDLSKFTDEEKKEAKEQVAFYKSIRHIIQYGNFYRLKSPFDGNHTAWMFVTEDKKEAFVAYFKVIGEANTSPEYMNLKGLNENFDYKAEGSDRIIGGDLLMNYGIRVPNLEGDYKSAVWHYKAV